MQIVKIINLIKAICTRVQELEGYLNKTKLIKLLYLIDIEYYRKYKKTYTDFNWIYYEYGPWAYEYNDIYDQIKTSPDFKIITKDLPQKIEVITCISDEKDFSDIFKEPEESLLFRELINKWALEDLNRILNYVYFYTQPMIGAKKNEKLDFSKIYKIGEIPKFKLQKGTLSPERIKAFKSLLKNKLGKEKRKALQQVVKPKYDDIYWQELEKLDNDYEY
jgi:hypothetical protein